MVVLFSFGMCLFSGCGTEKEGKRGKDLDYTVVPTEECPADFLAEINKKKINPFQMTYEDGEYCYLAVGYGEQETNGFSVRVLLSVANRQIAVLAIWRLATESRKPTVVRCVSLASMKKATGWCLRRIF